jgi:hypothetical protein
MEQVKCAVCPVVFEQTRKDRVCCSPQCSLARWKKQHPEQVKASKRRYKRRVALGKALAKVERLSAELADMES